MSSAFPLVFAWLLLLVAAAVVSNAIAFAHVSRAGWEVRSVCTNSEPRGLFIR